ncbi:uncharacterized protein ACO6RY_17419 [Pungitius sinensis]
MEGEEETAEEKQEEEELLHHIAAASSVDDLGLPIMQWEDLSQRIAELEKQEQERRERSKEAPGGRMDKSRGGAWSNVWEEEDASSRRHRVAVLTSRFHNHRKLQLCFINSSDSEDEEGDGTKKVSMGTGRNGCYGAGLKQEVASDLRTLRDKLLAEQKDEERVAAISRVAEQKHLERWELQMCSLQQLVSLGASLQQDVHALSSQLVSHLVVRDQLRTKQDAVLLDVQDLT